jgi:hypothetical protein
MSIGAVSYEFDEDSLHNFEAIAIEDQCGLRLAPFLQGLREGSIKALTAAWWICRWRQDKSLRFQDMKFPLAEFNVDLVATPLDTADAELDDEEAGLDEDDGEPGDPKDEPVS